MQGEPPHPVEPYVSAERSLPEVTWLALALGAVLSVVMGAANTYLGLKVGMTARPGTGSAQLRTTTPHSASRRGPRDGPIRKGESEGPEGNEEPVPGSYLASSRKAESD